MGETATSDDRTALPSGPADRDAQPADPSRAGSGAAAGALAVAALAVGVLACSFSWMFSIGTYIVVAGLAAVLLGVAGALVARRARHSPCWPWPARCWACCRSSPSSPPRPW